ncbi:MAG TPA: alpha/beta fold hydrolase [Gaiellales bacterium]|jgi:pimeloyl-ACP methyl ester carboxylesterase
MRVAPGDVISDGLAYGEWPGADPPVVLVPGIFATHRALASLAGRIAPAHRVIAFDLRGRGRSPLAGPFGIERHAADLWRAIDELELERPVLCGHSLGAFVVATAAAMRPGALDAVVLLDGGLWAPSPVPVELVHEVFAADRARLGAHFANAEAYADALERPLSDELEYELRASGDGVTTVMPAAAFDEDVASIAAHGKGNRPLASAGCSVLAVRALQGIGGDPRAQMLPDETITDARTCIADLRVIDLDTTHGALVREPAVELVAREIA